MNKQKTLFSEVMVELLEGETLEHITQTHNSSCATREGRVFQIGAI